MRMENLVTKPRAQTARLSQRLWGEPTQAPSGGSTPTRANATRPVFESRAGLSPAYIASEGESGADYRLSVFHHNRRAKLRVGGMRYVRPGFDVAFGCTYRDQPDDARASFLGPFWSHDFGETATIARDAPSGKGKVAYRDEDGRLSLFDQEHPPGDWFVAFEADSETITVADGDNTRKRLTCYRETRDRRYYRLTQLEDADGNRIDIVYLDGARATWPSSITYWLAGESAPARTLGFRYQYARGGFLKQAVITFSDRDAPGRGDRLFLRMEGEGASARLVMVTKCFSDHDQAHGVKCHTRFEYQQGLLSSMAHASGGAEKRDWIFRIDRERQLVRKVIRKLPAGPEGGKTHHVEASWRGRPGRRNQMIFRGESGVCHRFRFGMGRHAALPLEWREGGQVGATLAVTRFDYDPRRLLLTEVRLPTGAVVAYEYVPANFGDGDRRLLNRLAAKRVFVNKQWRLAEKAEYHEWFHFDREGRPREVGANYLDPVVFDYEGAVDQPDAIRLRRTGEGGSTGLGQMVAAIAFERTPAKSITRVLLPNGYLVGFEDAGDPFRDQRWITRQPLAGNASWRTLTPTGPGRLLARETLTRDVTGRVSRRILRDGDGEPLAREERDWLRSLIEAALAMGARSGWPNRLTPAPSAKVNWNGMPSRLTGPRGGAPSGKAAPWSAPGLWDAHTRPLLLVNPVLFPVLPPAEMPVLPEAVRRLWDETTYQGADIGHAWNSSLVRWVRTRDSGFNLFEYDDRGRLAWAGLNLNGNFTYPSQIAGYSPALNEHSVLLRFQYEDGRGEGAAHSLLIEVRTWEMETTMKRRVSLGYDPLGRVCTASDSRSRRQCLRHYESSEFLSVHTWIREANAAGRGRVVHDVTVQLNRDGRGRQVMDHLNFRVGESRDWPTFPGKRRAGSGGSAAGEAPGRALRRRGGLLQTILRQPLRLIRGRSRLEKRAESPGSSPDGAVSASMPPAAIPTDSAVMCCQG